MSKFTRINLTSFASMFLVIFLIYHAFASSSYAQSFLPGDSLETQIKLNQDKFRNASQIIKSRGFGAQEYNVITRDGYILTIQRIVNPLVRAKFRPWLKPIIMQHGLFTSSIDWIIDSPNVKPDVWPRNNTVHRNFHSDLNSNSSIQIDTQEHPNALGFYMANRGYDVWLANLRCNLYGQKHVYLSVYDPQFWNFSLDEFIEYDLPDTIEYVRKITGKSKIGFVGHSQGTTIMFALLASKPKYNHIIKPFVALAPIAYTNHIKSPIRILSTFEPVLRHINSPFLAPATLIRSITPLVCEPRLIREQICENIVFLFSGFNTFELDLERSTALLSHVPSGTSIKQVNQYLQFINSGRFARYDHGPVLNKVLYGDSRAPGYNLAKIRSKSIILFVSANDWLGDPIDVSRLLASLQVEPYAIFNISNEKPRWDHFDFIHSIHTGPIINTKIEKVFREFD